MFSARSDFPFGDNGLEALRRQASSSELLDWTISSPERAGFELPRWGELVAASVGRYVPEPRGLMSARTALAARYRRRGVSLSPDELLLTASTSEAYTHLLTLLCDPGEGVLVPEPSYPLFQELSRLASVELVPYRLAYDGAWHIDRASLEAGLRRARAVFVVSPNNPTGHYLDLADLSYLQTLGLPLVIDEVFRSYAWADGARLVEPLAAPPVLTCSLEGLSKSLAAPGLKLGWMAVRGPGAPEALRRLECIADTYLSVNQLVQDALPTLLEREGEVQRALLERVRGNLELLRDGCRGTAITPLRGEGAGARACACRLCWTRTAGSNASSPGRPCGHIPGGLYDFQLTPVLVVSLLLEPERFAEALRRLRRCVEQGVQSASP